MNRLRRIMSRVLRWSGRGLLGIVVVLLVVLVGSLLVLRLDAARAQVERRANAAVSQLFRGRVVVDRVSRVDLGGARVDAHVLDPEGRRVLEARGLEVNTLVPRMLWTLLTAEGPHTLVLDEITVSAAEVVLIDDGRGTPTLAHAFAPRVEEDTGDATTTLSMPSIRVRHVWVRGDLAPVGHLDADVALVAKIETGPAGTEAHLEQSSVRARNVVNGLPLWLRLSMQLATRAGSKHPTASADLAASAPGVELLASGAFRDGVLDAKLEVPRVEPDFARRFAPTLELEGGASGTVRVRGPLRELAVDARFLGAGANVAIRGKAGFDPELRFSARTEIENLDLASLVRAAPASKLAGTLDVEGRQTPSGLAAKYVLDTRDCSVSGTALPDVSTSGELSLHEGGLTVEGDAQIEESGADAELTYALVVPHGAAPRVEASWLVQLSNPARLRRMADLEASGSIRGRASLLPDSEAISGELIADFSSLSRDDVRLGPTRLEGKVSGEVTSPRVDAKIVSRNAKLPFGKFESARVAVDGTLGNLELDVALRGRLRRIDLSSRFSASDAPTFHDVALRIADDAGPPLDVRAERVRLASKTEVSKVRVSGAGRAEASLSIGSGLERLDAKTEELDLARLARLAGVPGPKSAQLSATFHYDGRSSAPELRARGELTQLAYGKIRGLQSRFDVAMEHAEIDANVSAEWKSTRAELVLSDVRLPKRLTPSELIHSLDSRGRVALKGSVNLACLEPLAEMDASPLAHASGRVDVDVLLEGREGTFPVLQAEVVTRRLELVGRREEEGRIDTQAEAIESEPWSFSEVDLDARVEVDGERRLSARLSANDRHGDLLQVDLDTRLPERIETLKDRSTLETLPWNARLLVAERSLESLPPMVRPESSSGRMRLEILAEGSVRAPDVELNGSISGFRPRTPRDAASNQGGFDLTMAARYAKTGGELNLLASRGAARVARAAASWSGDAALLANGGDVSPIRASVQLEATGLPLDSVPPLEDRGLRGSLSGDLRLEDLGHAARLRGRLALTDLEVQRAKLGRLDVDLATGRELEATLTSRGPGGSLHVDGKVGMRWGDRLVPEFEERATMSLRTREFRLGALEPLLAGDVSEVDGRLDANIDVIVDGGVPRAEGSAALSHGVLQIPAIGQRFHDVSAEIDLDRKGVRVRDVKAKGVSGALRGSAELQLSEDLAIERINGELHIRKADKIPITVEGQTVGDGWGNLYAEFVPREDENVVEVDLRELHLEMPDAASAGMQELGPNEHVTAGVWQGRSDFAPLPLQPIQQEAEQGSNRSTTVVVRLGKVHIQRGEEVEVELHGRVTARIGETTRLDGAIEVREGTLDVFGKTFQIERGTVKFHDDEPDDAVVSAVARWDSPLGYEVYAEYVGSVSNGKIELRSDPPLARDQVLSLVLFGTPDGSVGAGGGNSASAALGVAGGTATRGLNRALDDFTELDVQTRVDTSSGEARPELVVQLTPRVAARVTRALGEPTPGMAADRTTVTLDFRLDQRWSLSARVGDQGGSALDLIWRRSY